MDIRFLRDVSSHQMTIFRDEGEYRHLRFSRPGSSSYGFDLITWPGYLTVTGDMGTWTFSRVRDMFDFFVGQEWGINPYYWSEKLEVGIRSGRHDIAMEFDSEAFNEGLQSWLNDWLEWCPDYSSGDKKMRREAQAVIKELQTSGFSNEQEACAAVYAETFPGDVSAYDILEGINCRRYTLHYLWICYAIVWGITRYRRKQLVSNAMNTFLNCRGVA